MDEGFIDFIVEPSFQVMSDVIDKILEPEREQQVSGNNDPRQCSKTSAAQQGILTFYIAARITSTHRRSQIGPGGLAPQVETNLTTVLAVQQGQLYTWKSYV